MAEVKSEAKVTKAVKDEDPWKQMVTIKLPKLSDGSANYQIASVNGRVFKIQRGVSVDVPMPIAKVLQNSEDAREEADAFIDGLTN